MNKKNPFRQKDAEIAHLKQLLQAERDKVFLQAFADDVAKAWLLQEVWTTPPDKWPTRLKWAFNQTAEKSPTIGQKWQNDWIEYHRNKQ